MDGLSQVVCTSADEALKLYEDGYQALNALKLSPCVVSFTVKILQRPTGTLLSDFTKTVDRVQIQNNCGTF